ncbi:MAG: LPS export ABC transporter periplasmic protein LptC, partial [Spirochaetota bacterium]
MIKLNNRKIRISFFSLMTVFFLVVIVSLILISLLPNMKDKNTGSSFNLDLNNEKFKGVYPDIIMINGKIGSVTNDNQKIIIYYKRILQYSSLNYLKIENPIIYIYNSSEKIYYITSKIAYTENLDNIKKISFQENTTINDLKQNIIIEGDLFKCDIENRVITSDIQSTVKKDGFVINSIGIYIDDNYAIFKNNVDIINNSGFY